MSFVERLGRWPTPATRCPAELGILTVDQLGKLASGRCASYARNPLKNPEMRGRTVQQPNFSHSLSRVATAFASLGQAGEKGNTN